jgi:hypothetical protein
MMANNGSVALTLKIGGTVVGVVTLLITIYCVFHQPLACAIATEERTRVAEDVEIRKEIQLACIENMKQYNSLDKKLERVLVKLERMN